MRKLISLFVSISLAIGLALISPGISLPGFASNNPLPIEEISSIPSETNFNLSLYQEQLPLDQHLHATPTQLQSHPPTHRPTPTPPPNHTPTATDPPLYDDVPPLEEFRQSVMTGESSLVTGIWSEGILAYKVVKGSGNYVPSQPNTASTYDWAFEHDVTGLLIHDYLGGSRIYHMAPGTPIAVIHGDGDLDWYVSQGGTWYEAKHYSAQGFAGPFRIWDCGECSFEFSVEDILWQHYAGTPHIAIQTCVKDNSRFGMAIYEAVYIGEG
jgi:hypothetical protein